MFHSKHVGCVPLQNAVDERQLAALKKGLFDRDSIAHETPKALGTLLCFRRRKIA